MSRGGASFVQLLVNPFSAYAGGFLFALSIYSLGYSDLYPALQPSLAVFLLVTCAICSVLALIVRASPAVDDFRRESVPVHSAIFLGIFSVFALEIMVNGGVPLLQVIDGSDYSYFDFGIPVLHVAFSGFCYFFAVYWFDLYLLRNGATFLFFSLMAFSTSLATVSRGAFIVTLVALVGVYIQRRGLSRRLTAGVLGALRRSCMGLWRHWGYQNAWS